MKKIILFLAWILFFGFSFATDYLYFYSEWCQHCAKVDSYLTDNNLYKKYGIQKKEIRFNSDNVHLLQQHYQEEWIDASSPKYWQVPFLVVDYGTSCVSFVWELDIIKYFQDLEDNKLWSWVCLTWSSVVQSSTWTTQVSLEKSTWEKLAYFGVIVPAALADSINPCAFTVMLLLLGAILTKHKSVKKVFLAWALFVLAVFLSYFLMGIWLYKAFASTKNTYYLKLVVWIVWFLIWLANLKDYFWYGRIFVMEVPFSWRPTMQRIISKVVSPWWAFVVWIIVSLFLLPCTSWPYFTILWYLASQDKTLTDWWYAYLFIYNLLFVTPMIWITLLIWLWIKDIDELAKFKHKNTKLIHLIVWLIMIGLSVYVFATL